MPEFVEDPSLLTKERLRSELLAHSVELPSGTATKDVYVQLYLENLTPRNRAAAALDAFSSDEEPPPRGASGRIRSSNRVRVTDCDWGSGWNLTNFGVRRSASRSAFISGPADPLRVRPQQ